MRILRVQRNKAAIIASGIDPNMKRLYRLHAIRSSRERALKQAQENLEKTNQSIEHYWAEIEEAVLDQQAISEVH